MGSVTLPGVPANDTSDMKLPDNVDVELHVGCKQQQQQHHHHNRQ
jgi:hypothetical protein